MQPREIIDRYLEASFQSGKLLPSHQGWYEGPIKASDLYDAVAKFGKLSPAEISRTLMSAVPGLQKVRPGQSGVRSWAYIFPPIAECQATFDRGRTASAIVDYTDECQVKLRMVAECRKVHGRKAASQLWMSLGLPDPGGAVQPSILDVDPVRAFIRDCVSVVPGQRVSARAMYEAYQAHCEQVGQSAITETKFGRVMKKKFKRDDRSRIHMYCDVRLQER